ncbi:unnamed protein product [Urochloa humidicola]
MRATAAVALLLPLLLLAVAAAAAGNGSCERACGELTVQFPFGFSLGCEIRLGCDHATGTAWLGGELELGLLVRNVTARELVLTLSPDCSRRLDASVDALFSDNYAPASQNALVVSNCSRDAHTSNCSVLPSAYLASDISSHCSRRDADSVRCVVPPPPLPGDNVSILHRFLNRTEMQELGHFHPYAQRIRRE